MHLAVNKKNYLTSLQQIQFFLQFNEPLFKAVVLFCQGLSFFLCLAHLVHFGQGGGGGVDVCTGVEEVS